MLICEDDQEQLWWLVDGLVVVATACMPRGTACALKQRCCVFSTKKK
jgi:hypothetical protein